MTDTPTTCARGCVVPGSHLIQHPAGSLCTGCMPRTVMRGTTVCGHCATVFAGAFGSLRTIWPTLTSGTVRPRSAGAATGRVQTSKIADLGDYWRPDVAQLLTDARDWLRFLAISLSDTKALAGYQLELLSTDKLLALLEVNARPILIANPEMALGLVKNALRLRHRAYRVIDGDWVRRIPLPGRQCLSDVDFDDPEAPDGVRSERCSGDLVAILQPLDAGGDSAIVCSRYPREHRISPERWDDLAEQLEQITEGAPSA